MNLMLKWEKCHFTVKEARVFEQLVFERGIEVDKEKSKLIEKIQPPTTLREVLSFLGHARFYQRFIKDFPNISKPLMSLLMKEVEFILDERCCESFQ